jgi:flagellar biosynthesis/type III secretory pathway M-ring protein FliF/YscJ
MNEYVIFTIYIVVFIVSYIILRPVIDKAIELHSKSKKQLKNDSDTKYIQVGGYDKHGRVIFRKVG